MNKDRDDCPKISKSETATQLRQRVLNELAAIARKAASTNGKGAGRP